MFSTMNVLFAAALASAAMQSPAAAQDGVSPILRIDEHTSVPRAIAHYEPVRLGGPRGSGDPCCDAPVVIDGAGYARHGQSVPGGGTLSPLAFINPAVISNAGMIAFVSDVSGSSRNQGVFVSDGTTLTVIARGCGGSGGSGLPGTCGDPTPIGGTFGGFFQGTFFAPPINDNGDVLFLADVANGSSPRGLFLYRADTGQIVKVAAVGDPSPIGGTITSVGPGSLNNNRTVAFLAYTSSTGYAGNYHKWEAGVVSTIARVGDAAPGGGTFSSLGRESVLFADSTRVPVGPVPAINDAGQFAFGAVVSGGPVERGILLSDGVTHQWVARNTDVTPIGGNYFDFYGPVLNSAGQIAFYADVRFANNTFSGGWFVATGTSHRKVLAFYDSLLGGQCFGLAVSRTPLRALDDCGALTLWTSLRLADLTDLETFLLASPDGTITELAHFGQSTPIGGLFGALNAWPTANDRRQSALGAGTPGAPGGVLNAHFVYKGKMEADLDGDGSVNLGDLSALLTNFGLSSGMSFEDGDLDGDGDVDLADLSAVLSRFGVSCW
ncbi:MAG: hypothetical protein HRF50_14100 [Phycisphaerae bacterium]|jgi:hypothetical protein